ncbi:MAG: hypothetical protein QM530_10515 [Phycisphaerales bacterium]|nr:hypothetical protein [Phycisphaerales bacterium]
MNKPTFDLVEIIKIIQRNLKMILGITFLATAIGAIGYNLKDKEYEAKAEAYMLNPLFGDRNHILRRATADIRFVDYFGTEGDVDKAMALIASKNVEDSVISVCDLYKIYQLDPTKAKDRAAISERYRNNFEAKRTENASIMCSYTDTDPERSAKVLDHIVKITDYQFRQYLFTVKTNAEIKINKKISEIDLQINHYTDSLIAMRNLYKIYDIISPNRQNMIVNSMSANGKVNPAEGVEKIQNIESIKDQMVISRAELVATAHELNTTNLDEMSLLHYVSAPSVPNKPSGIGFVLTVFACAFAAFFFSVLLFSFTAYIKALADTER